MPYIDQERRHELRVRKHHPPQDVGELNYVISDIVDDYVLDRAIDNGKRSYAVLNDVMGVLAAVQAEFYRRVVAPYEDGKRAENGEVFFSARGHEAVQ